MNILQNLFQHSKALLHLANLFSFFLKLTVMEQKKILALCLKELKTDSTKLLSPKLSCLNLEY